MHYLLFFATSHRIVGLFAFSRQENFYWKTWFKVVEGKNFFNTFCTLFSCLTRFILPWYPEDAVAMIFLLILTVGCKVYYYVM